MSADLIDILRAINAITPVDLTAIVNLLTDIEADTASIAIDADAISTNTAAIAGSSATAAMNTGTTATNTGTLVTELQKLTLGLPAPLPVTAYDLNFVTGDSPILVNFNLALGRNVRNGWLMNFGDGFMTLEYKVSGAGSFSSPILVVPGQTIQFLELNIHTMQLSWVSDTAYSFLGV
jgi:hypothetical protein